MEIKIERENEFEIAVKVYEVADGCGNRDIPKIWDKYLQEYDETVSGMLGVCISKDVCKTADGTFAYGIGNFKDKCKVIPKDFQTFKVPAGLWGKFYAKGKMPETIQNLWKEVFDNWLPNSGYRACGGFDFEYYTDGDTDSDNYVSGIWIMLESAD